VTLHVHRNFYIVYSIVQYLINCRPNFEFVKYPTLLCWHWCC